MNKKIKVAALVLMSAAVLSGCVPGDGSYTVADKAGFFSGIWHGWIAPFTLVGSIFVKNIRIYEPINTGWFYDLGFYMAVISGVGGLSLKRKKNKDD